MDRHHFQQPDVHSKQREEVDEMDFTQAQSFVAEHIVSINFGPIRQASYDLQTKKPKSIYCVQEMSSFKSLYKTQDIRNEAAKLERNYQWHLGIRGDGNCFYRSIIILYLIRITESPDLLCKFINSVYKLTHIQSSLTSKGINCDDLKAIFLGFLIFLMEAKKEGQVDNFNDVIYFYNQLPEVDLAAIVITRFMIFRQFIEMKNDPQLRYFIEERMWNEGPVLILTYFECAEDIIISLSASAFSCNINVQHFYRAGGDKSNGFMNKFEQYKPQLTSSKAFINVLFLNGHYEALLGHREGTFYQLQLFNEEKVSKIVSDKIFFDIFNRAPVQQRTNNRHMNQNKNSMIRSSSVQARQTFGFNSQKAMQYNQNLHGVTKNEISDEITQKSFDEQIQQSDVKINEQTQIQTENPKFKQNYVGDDQQNGFSEYPQQTPLSQQKQQIFQNPFSKKIDPKKESDTPSYKTEDNKQKQQSQLETDQINSLEQSIRLNQVKISQSEFTQTSEMDFDCFICYHTNLGIPLTKMSTTMNTLNVCGICMKTVIKKGISMKIKLKSYQDNLAQQSSANHSNQQNLKEIDGQNSSHPINTNLSTSVFSSVSSNFHNKKSLDKQKLTSNTESVTAIEDLSKQIISYQQSMEGETILMTQIPLQMQNKPLKIKAEEKTFLDQSQNDLNLQGIQICILCSKKLFTQRYYLEEIKMKELYGICRSCIHHISAQDIREGDFITIKSLVFKINDKTIQEISKQNCQNKEIDINQKKQQIVNKEQKNSNDLPQKHQNETDNHPQKFIAQQGVIDLVGYNVNKNYISIKNNKPPQTILSEEQKVPKVPNSQQIHICQSCLKDRQTFGKMYNIFIANINGANNLKMCQKCILEQKIDYQKSQFIFQNQVFYIPKDDIRDIQNLKKQKQGWK